MNIVFINKITEELEIINIDSSKDITFKKDRMVVYSGNSAHYCDMIYNDYLYEKDTINDYADIYLTPFESRILDEIEHRFKYFSNKKKVNKKDIRKELGILGEV